MGSLIGKALAVRNAAPIPLGDGGRGFYKLPGLAMGSDAQEAYMRAAGTVGTVWQIVHLLSSNVAKPEWRMYRSARPDGRVRYTTSDQGSDQRTEVVRHAALSLLARPNPFYSRFGLFEASQQMQELTGEWFWVVERDPRSTIPMCLWPVRPDRLDEVPDPGTYLKGWVYSAPDGVTKIPLMPDEVIQGKYPNPLNPYRGLGPIQSVLTEVDADRYASEWNRNFFINSADPGGIIQLDHKLEDDEFNDLVNRWRESHRGVARAHRVGVLESGATWVPNLHVQKDMDFVNGRQLSRDLIREAFGIHKIMLGNSDDVNRANAQTGEEVFANWSVAPRLQRWRDVLNYQYLPLFGAAAQGVEFDFVYPLPQNREQDNAELLAKTQGALWLVQAGYNPDDVLEVVGLPDMGYTPTVAAPPAIPEDTGGDSDAGESQSTDVGNRRRPVIRAGKDTQAKVVEQLAEDYPPVATSWVHHASWSGPTNLPSSHIDPDMQWVGPADPDHVQDFVKILQNGKKLKPVILVKTPSSNRLQLSDGHHRYLAYNEVEQPVRSYIATVDAEHGGWEKMHRYQKRRTDGGGGTGGPGAEWMRQVAAWNALAGDR